MPAVSFQTSLVLKRQNGGNYLDVSESLFVIEKTANDNGILGIELLYEFARQRM
jgi:hypothetical protein